MKGRLLISVAVDYVGVGQMPAPLFLVGCRLEALDPVRPDAPPVAELPAVGRRRNNTALTAAPNRTHVQAGSIGPSPLR